MIPMSTITQLFQQKSCVFSIECFPPKQTTRFAAMQDTLRRMKDLHPDFISVTYGAGGSAGGVSSVQVAEYLRNELDILPLAHTICMGSDRQKMQQQLENLSAVGVRNVLALRGDRTPLRPESPDFHHASDLMDFIRQAVPGMEFSGACYPEGHPEAPSLAADVSNLVYKQQAGAVHFVTQLFFDNGKFYRFLNMARKAGITRPISAGVMPIVRRSQIERTVALSSASLPSDFTRMVSRWQDDPASLYKAGIEYAVTQMRDLIEGGADGVHLYAMNDAGVAAAVYDGIRDLLG